MERRMTKKKQHKGDLESLARMDALSRRSVLYGLGGLAASVLLPGCGQDGANISSAIPATTTQPTPQGTLTAATLNVGSPSAYSIASNFVGLSYEKSMMTLPMFSPNNVNMIGLFKRLGVSMLRIGGISADNIFWNPTGAGQTTGQVAPSDIDSLAAFLQATGWNVLYTVNLETSTPQQAAAEVVYAVKSLGSSLYGIEIGNEPDGYAISVLPGWNYTTYKQRWLQFRAAIVAQSPNVVITGPASGGASYSGSTGGANPPASNQGWTVPFANDVGKQNISLLTQHYYRGPGSTATLPNLISYPDSLLTGTTYLGGTNGLQATAANNGTPYRLTETNSFYNGGAEGISDAFASALWVLDHLFTLAQYG